MEISTTQIFARAESQKTDVLKFLDKIVYWFGIGIAVLGNFVISIVLLPFIIVMSESYLYVTLMLLGVGFGTIIHLLLREIEHLQHKHHIIVEIFIPCLALINVYIITGLGNKLASTMQIETFHEPVIAAVIYVVAFFLPHLFFLLRKYHRIWGIRY